MMNEVCPLCGEPPEAYATLVVLRVTPDYVTWVHTACRAAIYRNPGAPHRPPAEGVG